MDHSVSKSRSHALASDLFGFPQIRYIFEQLAQDQNVPKKQAQELLAAMIERVTSHLKQGNRIRINGLGTLEVRKREARTGRNPATGEALHIAASKKVAFRPAKELKEAV